MNNAEILKNKLENHLNWRSSHIGEMKDVTIPILTTVMGGYGLRGQLIELNCCEYGDED